MLYKKHPSCGGRDVKPTFLHDQTTEVHVPRDGSRARIFSLEGLPNFMTKNVFQLYPIVSILWECSGKIFPKSGRVSMDPPTQHCSSLYPLQKLSAGYRYEKDTLETRIHKSFLVCRVVSDKSASSYVYCRSKKLLLSKKTITMLENVIVMNT